MSLHDRTPYDLACRQKGKQGLETDRLARVIRTYLPSFLKRCEIDADRYEEEPETPASPDRPLLEFEYENWRGDKHTYLIEPEGIEYGGYDWGGYHGEDGPQRWVLHGMVVTRDDDPRPDMDTRRRTFVLDKVQFLRELERDG